MDIELVEWAEKYGEVTDFSFMVYGPFSNENKRVMELGLALQLGYRGYKGRILVYDKVVDEETARALLIEQGINVHVVLPEIKYDLEEDVAEITLDCLRFLRLKSEYNGSLVVASLV